MMDGQQPQPAHLRAPPGRWTVMILSRASGMDLSVIAPHVLSPQSPPNPTHGVPASLTVLFPADLQELPRGLKCWKAN